MNKAPLQTEADLDLVKNNLLLPILMDVLEWDLQTLRRVPLKMLTIYSKNMEKIQDQVTRDLAHLQHQLRKQGIRVYETKRQEHGIEASYLCRGYHHKYSMIWGFVKAELEKKLSHYMNIDLTQP